MIPKNSPTWPAVTVHGAPGPRLLDEIRSLAAAAEETDGNPPFSDQTLVNLRSARPDGAAAEGLLVLALYESGDPAAPGTDRTLVGVAVVSPEPAPNESAPDEPAPNETAPALAVPRPEGHRVLEMVVHPNYRNDGLGSRMAGVLAATTDLSRLRAWSHGGHAGAAALARAHGFVPVRELWRMRLAHSIAGAQMLEDMLPERVRLRTFSPGSDEEAWLAVNGAAFAHHAEQGSMTRADLEARMAEDWFDPDGFFLAVRDSADNAEAGSTGPGDPDRVATGPASTAEEILGFHWTKIHPATGHQGALGEVYVVGVAPAAQGMGLGRVLTAAGIRYLQQAGLEAIMLYVDADNTAAVSLYQKLGFSRWDADVMYAAQPVTESL